MGSESTGFDRQYEELAARLMAAQNELDWEHQLHDTFTRVGRGPDVEGELATAVHDLTALPVVIEDQSGRQLGRAGAADAYSSPQQDPARRRLLLRKAQATPLPHRYRGWVIGVAAPGKQILGLLAVRHGEQRAGDRVERVVQHAISALSLHLLQQRSLADTDQRNRRNLVDDLLNPALDAATQAALADRVRSLGHDPDQLRRVLILATGNRRSNEHLLAQIDRAAARLSMNVLASHRGSHIIMITSRPPNRHDTGGHGGPSPSLSADPSWKELFAVLTDELHTSACAVGVGGVVTDRSQLRRSYRQAALALAARQDSANPHGITVQDEIGLDRILLGRSEARHDTEMFVHAWLGVLLEYDAVRNTALTATLAAYLDCGCSYSHSAAALGIHRSTLRYRLQRIQDVTGYALSDPDTMLHLHVATRAHRLIRRRYPANIID